MPLELSIPILIIGSYLAAYGVLFPWWCGRDVRRLLRGAAPLPFLVLLILWLHLQRMDVRSVSIGSWSLHWLWYALPILVITEWAAMHHYLRAYGLRYGDLWE